MTTPRDALRALEQKWRERDVIPMRNAILHEGSYQIRKQCADELAAIVSQMDSEPTVERPPSFNQQEFDEMCEKGRVAWAGVDPNDLRDGPSESSPAGCERCVIAMDELAKWHDRANEFSQQFATAERTIAELREPLRKLSMALGNPCLAWDDNSTIESALVEYAVQRMAEWSMESGAATHRAESAELTNQQLAEKCLKLVAENDLLRARTADGVGTGDLLLMPRTLTAENGAKAGLLGEFYVTRSYECEDCEGDGVSGDTADTCEFCGGEGFVEEKLPISWTAIKEIYKRAVELFQKPRGAV